MNLLISLSASVMSHGTWQCVAILQDFPLLCEASCLCVLVSQCKHHLSSRCCWTDMQRAKTLPADVAFVLTCNGKRLNRHVQYLIRVRQLSNAQPRRHREVVLLEAELLEDVTAPVRLQRPNRGCPTALPSPAARHCLSLSPPAEGPSQGARAAAAPQPAAAGPPALDRSPACPSLHPAMPADRVLSVTAAIHTIL